MKKLLLLVFVTLFLFSCAAGAGKMNSLKLGMTRSDVIAVMGAPGSTSETQGVLYLKYKLRDGLVAEDYYVRIKNDKVDAYGRFGEFNLGY